MAAAELLGLAGCAVTLGPPDLRCCGRPLISNGLLDEAVANARHNVARLHEWAAQGRPIVACEPSCLLTIKDDYPALLRGDERARAEAVAAACLTFEELLGSILADDEATAARPSDLPRRAAAGARPGALPPAGARRDRARCWTSSGASRAPRSSTSTRAAAAWPARSATRSSTTRSRGSSASNGSSRPFARSVRDTVIVAPGLSCRLQIDHFTGRAALHPATFLRGLVVEGSP